MGVWGVCLWDEKEVVKWKKLTIQPKNIPPGYFMEEDVNREEGNEWGQIAHGRGIVFL